MKPNLPKYCLLVLCLLAGWAANAQINMQDSSAQVIAYWDMGEQHAYTVRLQKLRYLGRDTTLHETTRYDVDVSVIDSSEQSYTVRWLCRNFECDATNPLDKRLATIAEGLAVDIQTDELGGFQSVANGEAVRDFMAQAFDALQRQGAVPPERAVLVQQLQGIYANPSTLETIGIQDVLQFLGFHGMVLGWNEPVKGTIQIPNAYNSAGYLDSEVSIALEALDAKNRTYTIRSVEKIDSEQLTHSTYQYLKAIAEASGQEMVAREAYPDVTNTITTTVKIHNAGWILKSVQRKEVFLDGKYNVETRTIELK